MMSRFTIKEGIEQRYRQQLLRCQGNRSCEWWIYTRLFHGALHRHLRRCSYYWKVRKLQELKHRLWWKGDALGSLKRFTEALLR